MEGENQRNDDSMASGSGLNPDLPLQSIENNDTGSTQEVSAPMPRTGERRPQRGGLIRIRRHQRVPSSSQVPSYLLRARRGSSPAYAAALSSYLGPINPRGHQRLPEDPLPTMIPNRVQEPESYLRRANTENTQSLSRARNNNTLGSNHPAGLQLQPGKNVSSSQVADHTMADRVQPLSGNFHYTGPISYNPLTEALNPRNAQFYSTPMSPNPKKRRQMQSDAAHYSSIQRSDPANRRSSQRDSYMGGVEPSVDLQALRSVAVGSSNATQGAWGVLIPKQPQRKRGRTTGSKTNNTDSVTMQPPPPCPIAPSPPERSPVLSSAIPVVLNEQIDRPRSKRKTTFSLVKNAAAMLDPFTKIVPATVKLVADNDEVWEYRYAGTRRNWKKGQGGKVTVAKLNEWANAIIRRRLPGSFPPAAKKRLFSAPPPPRLNNDKWTEWERAFLEAHILDAVKAKEGNLDEEDWQLIADAQNEEFLGQKRLPGLPMALLTSRSLTINDVPVIRGGGYTKTEGCFPKRSSSEIQNILYHWPDIHEKIKQLIRRHRGKVPIYVDCDTDISDSERTSDDENGEKEADKAEIGASKSISEG
ncbi:uncharacterized protein EAE97_011840 [Botrytis byssoidea]|uniref:Uncharacterized protein n=1 Tax=Botrytis byssoidea TaxID=139641 RepID=A0A9P5HP68_9HELO|nr:uncharacterized protein EAE97_011840 [Botrytis byssoidea]KAF7918745.1 hypothetical protein EAE97_011840 [Botrytis byssoidea]